ncbi:MAG: ABC transporter permease [Limisphaerales bacterium]
MNALLRKELRMLLPAWVAALLAATLPLWTGRNYQGAAMPCFGLAVLFLGLTPFGQEMSCGTFGLLLSQPEKRGRFWKIKAGLLALAMLSAWAVFLWCGWLRHQYFFDDYDFDSFTDMAQGTGVMTLVAFSGGLWSTLLLRDLTTAFFATVMAPAALLMATALALMRWIDNDALMGWVVFCVMTAYSALGFFVARRLFLGAEDVPLAWTRRQVSVPKARGWLLRWFAFGLQKRRGPWSALIFKELQLQEITVILVPLLVFLHLAALALRHFAPQWAMPMDGFEGVVFIWMMVPFVIGCVAVAEERRYNTLESFLCLPVRKRNQFLVKFAVVMALGIALGGVLPWVLENIAGGRSSWAGPEELLTLAAWAAGVAAVSFFASTMSRGMLQAFTVGLLFPILLWLAAGRLMRKIGLASDAISFGGWLFPAVAFPAMLIAYFWMAFRNYQRLQTDWRLWVGNLIRFALVIGAVQLFTGEIYLVP